MLGDARLLSIVPELRGEYLPRALGDATVRSPRVEQHPLVGRTYPLSPKQSIHNRQHSSDSRLRHVERQRS
jgi:hypothetical protein